MIRLLLIGVILALIYYVARQFLRSGNSMSVSEAIKVLEVSDDADAETILAAHRRLIAKVHPDAGTRGPRQSRA
jgi:DnaJ homolog subfamily C member 19